MWDRLIKEIRTLGPVWLAPQRADDGDVMKLQIKVNDAGIIQDARFKTYGCGSAIASSSLVTEWVKGKTLDEATSIKNTEIARELSLPPVKIHCSILAEDAIRAAIEDYRKKHDLCD
jgi:nitrogen fixation NifU-like protein